MPDVALRVELPQSTVTELETRGKPEREIVRLVKTYFRRQDIKPMVLCDADRRKIEAIIGRNITHPEELITAIERLVRVTAGDVDIPLNERMLARLRVLLPHKEGSEFTDGVRKILTTAVQNYLRTR